MDFQIIRTPSGDEMVIMPRAHFDALRTAAAAAEEDEDDIALFDARMAELDNDRNALLPAEVTAFMLNGDALLRAFRRWRRMTRDALAAEAGLTPAAIKEFEKGRKTAPPDVVRRLATALGIDERWLQA